MIISLGGGEGWAEGHKALFALFDAAEQTLAVTADNLRPVATRTGGGLCVQAALHCSFFPAKSLAVKVISAHGSGSFWSLVGGGAVGVLSREAVEGFEEGHLAS
jgi:hypothetical protein